MGATGAGPLGLSPSEPSNQFASINLRQVRRYVCPGWGRVSCLGQAGRYYRLPSKMVDVVVFMRRVTFAQKVSFGAKFVARSDEWLRRGERPRVAPVDVPAFSPAVYFLLRNVRDVVRCPLVGEAVIHYLWFSFGRQAVPVLHLRCVCRFFLRRLLPGDGVKRFRFSLC